MNKRFIIINFAAFAVMLFLSTGCKQDGKQDAVPSYRVITVSSMPVEISESYSATIRGRQDVDIMPQISGRITRLCVKEGTRVTTGQVLAVIDQTPYLAALRTALANVSAARAKAETARIELQGKQALFDEKVISEYDLSLARNQLAVALAELQQAEAQEADARNNLSYTEIKSPSNGVVGTLPYRIGALVSPNMEQPFTVVSDNAEMYAYFSVSENMLRHLSTRYGSIDSLIAKMPEVSLQLNDGSLYKAKGRIETVSGVVDPATGAVQIKALFPNPERELRPSEPPNGCHHHSHDRHRGTARQNHRLPTEKRTGGSCLSHGGPPERWQPVYRKRRSLGRRHPHRRRRGTGERRHEHNP